tara:strand:- start:291 stop:2132 length:1842 start_codon:yes stop_codon:yes gene_type:complete
MNQNHRYQLGIVLIATAVMLTGLHATKLWDQDEGFFASTAAEMHAQGEWVVPTFNGSIFGHKPPWMYWMMMIGFELFGTTEFAARFFSAVFGIATCLLTYHVGKNLFSAQVGWWAGLVLATCILFNVVSRAATPDTYLTFFVTLSLYLFVCYGKISSNLSTSSPPKERSVHQVLPTKWRHFATIYAVMGFATLVKGPIGFLFPMAVIGFFLMCMTPRRELPENSSRWRQWREIVRPFGPGNFFTLLWKMRIFTAIAMTLAVAGPWFLAVGLKTNGAFIYEFFAVHHYQRFTTPMDNHSGSFLYYPITILVGMFPWSVFSGPTVLMVIRHLRKSGPRRTALTFLACWAGIYVCIFSLASTKLPNYILPACPAMAIMMGAFLQSWIKNPGSLRPALRRICVGSLPIVGLLILAGLPLAGVWQWDGQTILDRVGLTPEIQSHLIWVGLAGIPLLAGGIITTIYAEKGRSKPALTTLAWTSVVTLLCVWNFAAPQVGQYQTNGIVGKTLRETTLPGQFEIGHLEYFPPSLSFYSQRPINRLHSPKQAVKFLADPQPRLLITTAENYPVMENNLGSALQIVGRANRFPKAGEILILSTARSRQATTALPSYDSNSIRH